MSYPQGVDMAAAIAAGFVLDRREAVPALIGRHQDFLFVTGLAGTARDIAALTHDGGHIYTMAGAMGAEIGEQVVVVQCTDCRLPLQHHRLRRRTGIDPREETRIIRQPPMQLDPDPRLAVHQLDFLVVRHHRRQARRTQLGERGNRHIALVAQHREREALPPDRLILAALHPPERIEPALFRLWTELLSALPNAVLWLSAAEPLAVVELKRQAAERGGHSGYAVNDGNDGRVFRHGRQE